MTFFVNISKGTGFIGPKVCSQCIVHIPHVPSSYQRKPRYEKLAVCHLEPVQNTSLSTIGIYWTTEDPRRLENLVRGWREIARVPCGDGKIGHTPRGTYRDLLGRKKGRIATALALDKSYSRPHPSECARPGLYRPLSIALALALAPVRDRQTLPLHCLSLLKFAIVC